MVTTKEDFVTLARVYVTNVGYPSIHVYTVDGFLIDYLIFRFDARCIPHKGTNDVVISNRDGLCKAAREIYERGTNNQRRVAKTLLRYCEVTTPEKRRRVAKRLSRQLSLITK